LKKITKESLVRTFIFALSLIASTFTWAQELPNSLELPDSQQFYCVTSAKVVVDYSKMKVSLEETSALSGCSARFAKKDFDITSIKRTIDPEEGISFKIEADSFDDSTIIIFDNRLYHGPAKTFSYRVSASQLLLTGVMHASWQIE
jgi:hypothetical protein